MHKPKITMLIPFCLSFALSLAASIPLAQSPADSMANHALPQDTIDHYSALSSHAFRAGDLKLFKAYSEKVLAIAIAHDMAGLRVRALANVAIYYQETDQYELALAKYLEADSLAGPLPDGAFEKALVQANMGNLYNAIGQYENAITSMRRIVEIAPGQEYANNLLITAYSIIGESSLLLNDFDTAMAYMGKANAMAVKMGSSELEAKTLASIADCHRLMGHHQIAIDKAGQALAMVDSLAFPEFEAQANITIGAALTQLGQPGQALPPLHAARQIATKGGFMKIEIDAHQHISQAYEAADSLKASLAAQKAYAETREAYLKSLSRAQRLKLERDAALQAEVIKRQENSINVLNMANQGYVLAGLALLALLVASTILFRRRQQKLAAEYMRLQGDHLFLKSENEALKDRLNTLAKQVASQQPCLENTPQASIGKKKPFAKDEQHDLMKRILDYMEEKKPYLAHDVKQSDIAHDLDMGVHMFSEVLNACFQKNFNSFINLYRVDMAKRLMKDPKYGHYKVLAIGFESGFASKTSFNRVFKNLVGVTPSEYQKRFADIADNA